MVYWGHVASLNPNLTILLSSLITLVASHCLRNNPVLLGHPAPESLCPSTASQICLLDTVHKLPQMQTLNSSRLWCPALPSLSQLFSSPALILPHLAMHSSGEGPLPFPCPSHAELHTSSSQRRERFSALPQFSTWALNFLAPFAQIMSASMEVSTALSWDPRIPAPPIVFGTFQSLRKGLMSQYRHHHSLLSNINL